MEDIIKSLYTTPTLALGELIKDLTIGQRSINTVDQLSVFLHEKIFPKLGPFFTEIYFPHHLSDNFLPAGTPAKTANEKRNFPETIAGNNPFIKQIAETGSAAQLDSQLQPPLFTAETSNTSHLLVPILDGHTLSGLLYLGSPISVTFTVEFLDALQTLAAVIGSRLKSMATIRQLQESMHALAYSDRLRTALYEISEQAHYSKDIDDLYAKLHQKVGHLIYARNFFIALVGEHSDGKYIKFPYFIDEIDTHFQGMELQLDQQQCSITGYLLKTRQPLLLTPSNFEQICREQGIECVGARPYSWLGAPFFVGHIAGVVAIQSYSNVIYTEKDKELMAFVARHIGDALNRKRAVDELQKAKERAERVEKNKSIFLANMSHEIRTPMNGILGLTDLVLHSDISGQKRTYLEMIHSSADRLLKLINDILDFSKIEAGKLELNIAPFSLRATIAGALEILAVSASKKNIDLTVECNEDIPDILRGDAGKLSQILINLVGNGIKFTNTGKVGLTIQQEEQNRSKNDFIDLQFQIRDTGIGIPQEKIQNIFKAFSQLGTSQSSNQRGTGLGLVIAGELVEMMGGKICVESTPEVGTTFYFTIQFTSGATDALVLKTTTNNISPSAEDKPGGKLLHILLVEDEYINRTLAVTMLEREGWQVTAAENGLQALNILQNTSFDLILMDIQMPDMDGYETTKAIRLSEKITGRHIPIIAMTAHAIEDNREKCLAAGMDGYIAKPIRLDTIGSEIETILQSRSTGNQVNPQTP